MLIKQVKKLSPIERFWYWIEERHKIYERKEYGHIRPWTGDEVLQSYFFTNPYRENDKVTKWFRRNIRDPLKNKEEVFFATVCFRWFNWIPTGKILKVTNLLMDWDKDKAIKTLAYERDKGEKIFTGAFMISSPAGIGKIEGISERIDNVWQDKELLILAWNELPKDCKTMEKLHLALTSFPGMGGFMAYEVVCDLRYTLFLKNAPDKETWCHIGPGAIRGLYRLLEIPFEKGKNSGGLKSLKNGMEEMRKLLKQTQEKLSSMPIFEMREIEHSLCEWDKYERLLWDDGRSKRLYNGK